MKQRITTKSLVLSSLSCKINYLDSVERLKKLFFLKKGGSLFPSQKLFATLAQRHVCEYFLKLKNNLQICQVTQSKSKAQ